MCGIVSGIAQREISAILIEGLKRLEYRGYDSAGMAVIDDNHHLKMHKAVGKVSSLEDMQEKYPISGRIGIAHTRWATHGKPSVENAHPHNSPPISVVHNGIIENHQELKEKLKKQGYVFVSQTDSEVIAHLLHDEYKKVQDFRQALQQTVHQLQGAYAIAAIHESYPDTLLAVRKGSPLVVGLGIGETFVASDQLALRQVTDRFVYLDDGDMVECHVDAYRIWDSNAELVDRSVELIDEQMVSASKGNYRHYMQKEIFEQPKVIESTLYGRLGESRILDEVFGEDVKAIFEQVDNIQIVACGTSYHAGVVAKYWFEELSGIACQVEVASEYRYRKTVVRSNTLLITISQSGETADTLAALRKAKKENYLSSLCICNVAQSSLVRESDIVLLTQAGPEIGVASTKAFTTQLSTLLFCVIALAKRKGLSADKEQQLTKALKQLPNLVADALRLDPAIKLMADNFSDKYRCLFLGRGTMYPVAMEGALKLKEISYIHAEAYPAGELKHGPLALVDEDMPIVVVAPNNDLLEKLKSNLEEVRARGGQLFVFADPNALIEENESIKTVIMPIVPEILAPIIYTIPLQLLSYYVALNKGTDVDQPRNLAKSVTVE